MFSYGGACIAMDAHGQLLSSCIAVQAHVWLWRGIYSCGGQCIAVEGHVQLWSAMFSCGALCVALECHLCTCRATGQLRMNVAGFSPILKVHSTKTSGLRSWQAACEQKFCTLDPGSVFKDYYFHRVRSLEEKLEDLASLSLNYWLTNSSTKLLIKTKL